jgi:hypothetical protein
VLAHARCNARKSDLLAAEEHLERWVERNRIHEADLAEAFETASVQHHLPSTLRVASWAYRQVHAAGGQVWVRERELRPLSERWAEMLDGP